MKHAGAGLSARARSAVISGAVLGALAVVAGAFGAHVLGARVPEGRLETFETGARFHMYHALALVLAGLVMMHLRSALLWFASIAFLAGVILFSGSLYALVIFDAPGLAVITPFGGVLLIVGWVLLAWGAARSLGHRSG